MHKHHGVVGTIQQEHVSADGVSFPDRRNLRLNVSHFGNDALNRDGCSGRRIFLLRVMAFDDARRIAECYAQCRGCGNFEEDIHADGEI